VRIVIKQTPEEAARFAARWMASRLRIRDATHKQATLAMSGGTAPIPLIAAMAEADMPWKRLRIFQVDERVAPNRDPARNVNLLDPLPIRRSQIIPMSVTLPRVEQAVPRYEVWLPERLDMVHLGLGDDGHTASWPPGDPVVHSKARVALVGPFNGHQRITLTPRTVNDARLRVLFVTGPGKAEILAAFANGDAGDLPIGAVHRGNTVLVTDAEAGALLSPVHDGDDD
jgi:6-phosphogluconolactonase/glucosamine-6-phosphate isomerase/deaminase